VVEQNGPVRRSSGALERAVLDVLAKASGPLTVPQVRDALSGDPAYTTVQTALVRLHAKGALTRERSGRSYAYRPVETPEATQVGAAARRMRKILDSGGDRRGVLARFVADLSPQDEALLADLLAATEPTETEPTAAGPRVTGPTAAGPTAAGPAAAGAEAIGPDGPGPEGVRGW
jgi:predicted transcriptional regulator